MSSALVERLTPILERVNTSFHWYRSENGPRHTKAALTQDLLELHVEGGAACGCSIIKPGTCTTRLALLDLDSHKGEVPWESMLATAQVLQERLDVQGYPVTVFRSSGGAGIHLFLLWEEEQDAASVRGMLRDTLAACNLRPGTRGVANDEVEIFPKQDAVPADGVGNMFILPFSGQSEYLWGAWQLCEPVPAAVERIPIESQSPYIPPIEPDADGVVGEGGRNEYLSRRAFALRKDGLSIEAIEAALVALNAAVCSPPLALTELKTIARGKARVEPEVSGVPTEFEAPAADPIVPRYNFEQAALFASAGASGWKIKDVLPEGDLAVLFGESGAGKSFFALDLAFAVALGGTWRDRRVTQGTVAYITAEGAGGFRKRLTAHAHQHGLELASVPLYVLGASPNFMQGAEVREVIAAVKALGPVSLLFVDTFAQVTPGANENSGEDVGRALGYCRGLSDATGAMVVLIHHAGKDLSKGARGWSGMRAAADCEIEVSRTNGERVARVTKLKEGDDGMEFGFRLLPVHLGVDAEGDPITSCVVEHTAGTRAEARAREPQGGQARTLWRLAYELAGLGDGSVPVVALLNEAVRRAPHGGEGRDLRRQHARGALNTLISGGWLRVEDEIVYTQNSAS